MKTERIFSLICEDCGEVHTFDPSSAKFTLTESDTLGPSIETIYEWKHIFSCKCGGGIGFNYLVWEYPEGCYDTQEVEVSGAEVKRHFTFSFRQPKTQSLKRRLVFAHNA